MAKSTKKADVTKKYIGWYIFEKIVWVLFIVVVVFIITMLVQSGVIDFSDKRLSEAYEECMNRYSGDGYGTLKIADNNNTLILDEYRNDYSNRRTCVYNAVKMPERVRTAISNTTSLDGTRTDNWDNLNAEWSYNGHTDHLHIVIYQK